MKCLRRSSILALLAATVGVATLVSGCKVPGGGFLSPILQSPPSLNVGSKWSGFWVVANGTTREVLLTDSAGFPLRSLLAVDATSTDVATGLTYVGGDTVLAAIEGQDRVMRLDIARGSGSETLFYTSTQLGGSSVTLTGLVALLSGDVLVNDGNTVERLSASGVRVADGTWPRSLQTTGTGLAALPSGGFVLCSSGSDVVRAYDASGATQLGTAAFAAAPDAVDCAVHDATGRVGTIFNNSGSTADIVRVYTDSSLAVILWTANIGVLSSTTANPRALAFRPNGNVLVVDGTSPFQITELAAATGSVVSTFLSTSVNGIRDLLVIP